MKDEIFEKSDEALMNQFKAMRERKIPSRILEGFSTSVERKILEKQTKKTLRPGFLSWAPVWVPAFAVLLLFASTVVLHYPAGLNTHPRLAVTVSTVSAAPHSEISDEVVFLRELGEWTEEDEVDFN